MRRTGWRLVQAIAGAVILAFLIRDFAGDWRQAHGQSVRLELHASFVIAALAVTWAMYGVLIWGWLSVLRSWAQSLPVVAAARIWTISSLGKYVPGRIWAIAGMAMMAQRRGVSPAAATGSAIIMQLIAIATGAMIAVALTGRVLLDRFLGEWGSIGAIAVAVVALLATALLASPKVVRMLGRIVRRPDAVQPVKPGAIVVSLATNVVAWAGYGLSLQLLARGTLPGPAPSWTVATGAFAASYITGYLILFLPGGFGVRELLIIKLLNASGVDLAAATVLAAASRVALTVNDVGAALPFLLLRSKSRDAIPAA